MSSEVPRREITRVKHVLETKHGVRIFPKRDLAIPVIERDFVATIVGDQTDQALRSLSRISDYLIGPLAGDQFGNDEPGRAAWRYKMDEEYGEAFRQLYLNGNQFRANEMAACRMNMELLATSAEDNERLNVARRMGDVILQWERKIAGRDPQTGKVIGKPYKEMESYEEKLDVVHFLEDKALEAIQLFSKPEEPISRPF